MKRILSVLSVTILLFIMLCGCSANNPIGAKNITIGGATFSSDTTEIELQNVESPDLAVLAECSELSHLTLSDCKLSDNNGNCVLSQVPWNWPDSIKTIKIEEENE